MLLSDPWIACLSCDDCRRWIVDLKKREFNKHGGKRIKRPAGSPSPCWQCAKCVGPEKSPNEGRKATLSVRNWQLIQAFFERRKPLDGVTRRLYGVIRWMLAEHGRNQRQLLIELTAAKAAHGR